MQLREEIHCDDRAQTVRGQDDRAGLGKLIQHGTLCSPAAVALGLVAAHGSQEPDSQLSEPRVLYQAVWQPGGIGRSAKPLPGPPHL